MTDLAVGTDNIVGFTSRLGQVQKRAIVSASKNMIKVFKRDYACIKAEKDVDDILKKYMKEGVTYPCIVTNNGKYLLIEE